MKKIFLLLFVCAAAFGQSGYTPTPENIKAREWFKEAKFGLFIHWGVSSSLGHGEWVMNNRNIKVEDYTRLKNAFYPHSFNAKAWVDMAKGAGMKYITLISRHHDSFSNWDTKQSDWKITNTPYQKDIVKQLADECHKQGIKLFLYYSLLDWYRSDYQYETGRTGKGTGRTQKSDWESYVRFMKAQLTELLTNYGEIAGIWFDGHWDQLDNDHDKESVSKVNWHYDEIYSLIHKLQPQALIGNNHHLMPIAGEDFQMFEKDLPGANSSGFGGQGVSELPLETCETISGAWGYNITDRNYKSTKELLQYLIKASGFGANFLLNVGPMPDGQIQPEFTERLEAMGTWLKKYGSTIYGTQKGFMRPTSDIAVTQKGNKVFLHLLNQKPDLALTIPYSIKTAKTFDGQKPVKFEKSGIKNYYIFDLKDVTFNDTDTIIELEINP
ncbi:alpha-L-fucosidase [Emticicia sp. CRIBPO]|uniref:alpha-L-fucosidase n=1 Tax=Emticicia sp. CRIBPO TaxID=2683258 RepID=UPI0014134290|nr:alpha-L-fucosidase [Emticicia sp. CRIBPO]NBA87923.1 alpha-L-fucosidase [Emticicia sp. CRIBPO]